MSGFELNKIAAAVLVAGLVAMIASKVGTTLYEGGKHYGEHEVSRGYTIEGAETETIVAVVKEVKKEKVDIIPLLASADLAKGQKIIKRCVACHSLDKGGINKVGPRLWDVVGRNKGNQSDYSYSNALVALKDKENWGYNELSGFLENPKKYMPGTKMIFAGLKKPSQRANLIAYMRTLSDNPKPIE
jgi:cytochrome c